MTLHGVYSPLVLGFDLTNHTLYDELYPIVANKRVISINQQWAGNAGMLVANSTQYFRCVQPVPTIFVVLSAFAFASFAERLSASQCCNGAWSQWQTREECVVPIVAGVAEATGTASGWHCCIGNQSE